MLFGIQSLRLQFSPFQFNLLSPLTHAFLHRKQGYVVSSTLLTQKMEAFDYFLVLDFEATCDNEKRIVPQVNDYFFFKAGLQYIIKLEKELLGIIAPMMLKTVKT